jgi:hypothetical protein
MRRNAFLLAIITGFFMFQPGFAAPQLEKCAAGKCSMQQACAVKKRCQKNRPKEDCNSNGCNPFMACWCGNFFVIERPFVSCRTAVNLNSEFVITDEKKITGVTFECWHPPEMI